MILGAIEGLGAWWLAAGIAASAPVVVAHLLGRRAKKIVFPPASLIADLATTGATGDRLREIARLSLRLVAILMIAAAFSTPVWRPDGVAGDATAGRDLLIIIDRSASMERIDRGVSLFDRAIAEALRRLDELDPASDRAAVLAAGATPIVLLPDWSANFAALRERLLALAPTRERGDANSVMRHAAEFVERSRDSGQTQRIIVISDAQASQWGGAADSVAGAEVDWVDLGESAPRANVALTGFIMPKEVVHSRESVRVGVRLALFGAKNTTIPVTLNVDGAAHVQAVTLEPGIVRIVWFDAVAPASGPMRLRAEIPEDALIADNAIDASVHVLNHPSVMIAASRRDAPYMDSLLAAIEAVTDAAPAAVLVDDFAPKQGGVIVLVGAIDGNAIERLRGHVAHGGSLVWIIDSHAAAVSLADAADRGVVPVSTNVGWRDDREDRVDPASARAFFGDTKGAAAAAIGEIARDTRVSGRAVVHTATPSGALRLDNGDPLVLVFDSADSRTSIITADLSRNASNIIYSVFWPMLLDRAIRRPAPNTLLVDALDPLESDLTVIERDARILVQDFDGARRAIAVRPSRGIGLAPMLLLAALAIVLGDLFIGTRSGAGWWIAGAGAALLVVPLVDPRKPTDAAPAQTLIIALDISESMATVDAGEDDSRRRIDAARAGYLTDETLHKLNLAGTHVVAAYLDGALTRTTIDTMRVAAPTGRDSPLVASIERAIHAVGANGRVLMLTDGADTERRSDTDAVTDRAVAANVRLDAVVVGSDRIIGEPRLIAWATPGAVFSGEPTRIVVEVAGSVGIAVSRLELRAGSAHGELIESREVTLADEGASEHVFNITPAGESAGAPGWDSYNIALVKSEEGVPEIIATQHVFIEVLDEPARVLVLEGQPGWQTAFFVDSLRDEPRLEVTSVSAVSNDRQIVRRTAEHQLDDDPAANPSSMFDGFDLIVLGRGVGRWVDDDAAAALERFVIQGGALLMLRGDPVADESRAHDSLRGVIERIAPFGGGQNHSLTRTSNDLTLMYDGRAGASESLLSVRQAGLGRSAIVTDSELWRSAFESGDSRLAFGEFWSRAARWLALGGAFMPGRYARLEFDDSPRAPGEIVTATLRVRGDGGSAPIRAVVLDPDGLETNANIAESGLGGRDRRLWFTPARDGAHVLRAEAREWSIAAPIMIDSVSRERIHASAQPAWLRNLTSTTGGRFWTSGEADLYVRDIHETAPVHSPKMSGSTPSHTAPIWNTAWFFTLLTGTIVAGWVLRREVAR